MKSKSVDNVIKMNNFKNVIIPNHMLFENGNKRSSDDISRAISAVYKEGGFRKEWGFSIMLVDDDGGVDRVPVEMNGNIKEPFDIVGAFFFLKLNHPEDSKNMYLCICGPIKSKKDLKMPKSARMLGKCRG
jgi:hypothetical protein